MRFAGTPESVRAALNGVRGWLSQGDYCDESCGDAELVLAELLNNIAEHAYAQAPGGPVELSLARCQTHLCLQL
ncbi:ATP-binding protein, partial [Actibacterium sp.]|uniref:ATP-binding protein n=1 Tax=Actibacterium sp. TaxID=1872125 RepID=UPI0035687722